MPSHSAVALWAASSEVAIAPVTMPARARNMTSAVTKTSVCSSTAVHISIEYTNGATEPIPIDRVSSSKTALEVSGPDPKNRPAFGSAVAASMEIDGASRSGDSRPHQATAGHDEVRRSSSTRP